MIFVDSCVWIDLFRGAETLSTKRLERLLFHGEACTGDLVLAEVLQGLQTDREFAIVRGRMSAVPTLTVSDKRIAVLAAGYYRDLRQRGITVRKTIDTLIAARCIADDLALLSSDRDFAPFHAHCGLRDALVEA